MEIVDKVKIVGEKILKANGYEFQRGFDTCVELFDIAIRREPLYNQIILQEELAKKDEEIKRLKFGLKSLQESKNVIIDRNAKNNRSLKFANKSLTRLNQFLKAKSLKKDFQRFLSSFHQQIKK